MEWVRWIITVLAIAGASYAGYKHGRAELLTEVQAQAIKDRDEANAKLQEQIAAGNAQAEQKAADLVAMQASIETMIARSGSIGAQMQRALHASNLGTCLLSADVQRVRTDAYEQARSAAAAANAAGSGH